MEQPLLPTGPKKSAKAIRNKNKSLWSKLKSAVTLNATATAPTKPNDSDLYVAVDHFVHEEYELDDAYYQSAYLLAHAPSGQHLNQRFDHGSRRVYNIIHSTWFQYYVYATLGIVHCFLGLYSTAALASYRSCQLLLEWCTLIVYLLDIWLVQRLTLQDESQRVTPKTRYATLQSHIVNSHLKAQPLSHWNGARLFCVVLFTIDLLCFMGFGAFQTPRYTTFLRPMMLVLRIRKFRHLMRAVLWSATHISRGKRRTTFGLSFFQPHYMYSCLFFNPRPCPTSFTSGNILQCSLSFPFT